MTRVKHVVAVALFGSVPLVGFACEDDPEQTRRREKDVRNLPSEQLDAEVFMDRHTSEAEIDDVRARLRKSDGVYVFSFLSKEAAYEEFKQLFEDMPDLIAATDPEGLPVSYRVVLTSGTEPMAFRAAFAQVPGVSLVAIFPDDDG